MQCFGSTCWPGNWTEVLLLLTTLLHAIIPVDFLHIFLSFHRMKASIHHCLTFLRGTYTYRFHYPSGARLLVKFFHKQMVL